MMMKVTNDKRETDISLTIQLADKTSRWQTNSLTRQLADSQLINSQLADEVRRTNSLTLGAGLRKHWHGE